MNELRGQCEAKANEFVDIVYSRVDRDADLGEYERNDCITDIASILSAFAREQRIQALQKAKQYISKWVQDRNEHRHCLTPAHQNRDSIRNGEIQIMDQWLDAEIQRMREEGK